jgi:hypothetical protein
MLLIFNALALPPLVFAEPRNHGSWRANAYNLTVVGAAWVIAEWLADRQRLVQNQQGARQVKPSPP